MTEMEKLADLILPDVDKTPDEYEAMYPPRSLPEGARVTRIAPSPTGYLHIGTLFVALVNRLVATSTGGVFFSRSEDTDKKREVAGGIADIIGGLRGFGVSIDEGFVSAEEEVGGYGPYQQSKRAAIYRCYVKELVRQGLAYPCFCTAEELAAVREAQEKAKIRTGYHGEYAHCRSLSFAEVEEKVKAGLPFVVRLRSPGQETNKVIFDDGIKGRIEMPENDEDFVLLKSDGIPTYHFAHAVDDHLMRTTHVIRGDEWISSTPKHLQLFRLLGWKPPKYVHVAPIMKEENGAKRKISKRKDPEAAVRFFLEQGFPAVSVMEYLMTIAASDFEDWRRRNPDEPYEAFKFNLKKMSVSGALYDWNKLVDVSKGVIARLSAGEVCGALLDWAKEYNKPYYDLLSKDEKYTERIFSIDRGGAKPRKDLAKWDEAPDYTAYFFKETFTPCFDLPENIAPADAAAVLEAYAPTYDPALDRTAWFDGVKAICPAVGFADDTKAYKQNPAAYKGSPGDASTVIRIAVTGRRNTPDLCSIMALLGREESIRRMQAAADVWKKE